MKNQIMHIGIDDTDSTRRGCTTYIAALLVEKLKNLDVKFIDYPNLIRLNPNVPWKTRGNGALCIRFEYDQKLEHKIKEITRRAVEKNSDLECENTNPGIVFFDKKDIPQEIRDFAKKVIIGVERLKTARKLLTKYGIDSIGFNNSRGLIGALGAIGEKLECDHTYELISYREIKNLGKKRDVDKKSIFKMDKFTKPFTFNNVDLEKKRVIITPRGPDPILFGIRGESAQIVKKAFLLVKSYEKTERWIIFRSNQGTDAHLKKAKKLSQIKPYQSVVIKGTVSKNPRIIPLRHVIFSIKDKSGEVDCAAYEPTGLLRKIARMLIVNDKVEVFGAVRQINATKQVTINLEKINILLLSPRIRLQNPFCAKCGKRLKSLGKQKGFRCDKCHEKYPNKQKDKIVIKRELKKGLYITSTRSQRHLTKPLRRYGLEKVCQEKINLIDKWHGP
ncbi:MAG: tRNA(Ile)(2)-agmatinylcytidine synthase [Candidatus Bathyarchaeota archaeon]|nr:tRNA(Ile)(2)-agmatinylcytidine synthase [Candidatus Bathyarchaeota archaeon]